MNSREEFLSAWKRRAIQSDWFLELGVDEEDLEEVEYIMQELSLRQERKDRVLRSVRGHGWARNSNETFEWLGGELHAELCNLDANLPRTFEAFDILALQPHFFDRASLALKQKMNNSVYAFAKLVFETTNTIDQTSSGKLNIFSPIEHLGEGGFGVCLSVIDKVKSTAHAMVGEPMAKNHTIY